MAASPLALRRGAVASAFFARIREAGPQALLQHDDHLRFGHCGGDGRIETLGLIGDKFGLTGVLWDAVGSLSDNFGMLGYLIIGIFVMSWVVSMGVYRLKGYDQLEAHASGS
jgi:hypothetical protein